MRAVAVRGVRAVAVRGVDRPERCDLRSGIAPEAFARRPTPMRTVRPDPRRPAVGAPALTIYAPAKLNLSLDVLGRRDDGFHALETLMVRVGWFDTLTFAPADHFALEVTGTAVVPADDRNLVAKAATALAAAAGVPRRGRVSLHKRIPHEAGLGGGSSDAAAALAGLNELWGCGFGRAELLQIAATLGSDVPFFLCGADAAVCGGRGEEITPLPAGRGPWAVVAKPPAGLSTATVFAAWGGSAGTPGTPAAAAAWRSRRWDAVAADISNHLDDPAVGLEPTLAAERDAFAACGMPRSCLTGSGTSRFALLPSPAAARAAAAKLRRRRPGPVAAVSLAP